jgi:glycosyltransferase involved in cell wall biosynthesis
MKILIVMDPGILVPPKGYGGHERLVEMFALEYTRLGHEVHLLVTEGSYVPGCIIHPFGKEGFPPKKWDARMAIPKAWYFLWKNRNKFDLVHNFGRLAYLLPILHHPVKKIMTYGREIYAPNIKNINRLKIKNLVFTAPSEFCANTGNVAGNWRVVYNAINFNKYTPKKTVANDAPLIFLSRIERLKGAHEAIEIALQTGNRLIIAGNISPLKEEQEYFKNEIEPFIDGEKIIYVGILDDKGKNKYLGLSKAMIFPAQTKEAFGMVMVEAMACGTPVIAYNLAAMPEVIENGITGFIVSDKREMILKIPELEILNREKCAIRAKQSYHVENIAENYLNLFYESPFK